MNLSEYPTLWQKKTLWVAVSAIAMVVIGGIAVGLIWLSSRVLGFLQPILIPFAVAGVMAYLLEPIVAKIESWGTTRHRAVIGVFAVVCIALVGILLWIVPAIAHQADNVASKVPKYTVRVKTMVLGFARDIEVKTGFKMPILDMTETPKAQMGDVKKAEAVADDPDAAAKAKAEEEELEAVAKEAPPEKTDTKEAAGAEPAKKVEVDPVQAAKQELDFNWHQIVSGRWVQTTFPIVLKNVWEFVTSSVGGFLGVFGFLLSMIIVPVYLWYFLVESPNIAAGWGDYLPLTRSAFKDEVVSVLSEINGYLIAFFRGQLIVSLINGTATGIGLMIVGLDFGILIGLMLCVLGIIPYIGIVLCWIPAVIIASVQGGAGTWIPGDPWWVFPLVVSGIFTVVQQIDGLFITPKIVGESVGLHPMTVIVSVFVWSLLMGGLLGAILAVPLTATVKVLLRRYVWEKRIRSAELGMTTEETAAIEKVERMESVPVGEAVHGK